MLTLQLHVTPPPEPRALPPCHSAEDQRGGSQARVDPPAARRVQGAASYFARARARRAHAHPLPTPVWQATNKPADAFGQAEEYADTIRQAVVSFTGHLPFVCCPVLLVVNFRKYVEYVQAIDR